MKYFIIQYWYGIARWHLWVDNAWYWVVLYNISGMLSGLFENCSYRVNKYVRLQFILYIIFWLHYILHVMDESTLAFMESWSLE